jgi:protoheme ferro-lyase
MYPLVDRLIRLILTLPVSTTTTKRAFSAMKIVKISLRNRIENDFLASYLNKTKSCWFFLQLMYNKLKQILYLIILFFYHS